MMNSTLNGKKLIEELLSDSAKFNEQGRAYQLLQQYFHGFSLKTLSPLLTHDDYMVKRAAIWIVSELGNGGCELINDVVPLIDFEDRYIKYHALESVMVCSVGVNASKFMHVVRSLYDNDPVIRTLTMRLMSNADDSQFEAAIRMLTKEEPYADMHKHGLSVLLNIGEVNKDSIIKMINDNSALIKKYGAIASKKLFAKYPELVKYAASNEDADVKAFSEEFISMQ